MIRNTSLYESHNFAFILKKKLNKTSVEKISTYE